jgi:hypothetical protein
MHPSNRERGWERKNAKGKTVAKRQGTIDLPSLRQDDKLRRAIYDAKRKTYKSPVHVSNMVKEQAKIAFDAEIALERQSFKPTHLASGIYKFYVNDQYACTATHVGGRLYVVLHCLSEDSSVQYKAVNHANTFVLHAADIVQVNKEIAYFPVSGVPSVWKQKDFKVLEDSDIVTVYGYGNGKDPEPDAMQGFASPLGWCNAPTRSGDCTAPVLNGNGKIVGFWTHGNGIDFGRFEPVTQEFIQEIGSDHSAFHTGLDFRSSPHSQVV